MGRTHYLEEIGLLRNSSSDSIQLSDLGVHEYHSNSPSDFRLRTIYSFWHFWILAPLASIFQSPIKLSFHRLSHRLRRRRLQWILATVPVVVVILVIIFTALFRPSYTKPPQHYKSLERTCKASRIPGRGNINNEKIFIAASLHDPNGSLLGGKWADAIVQLVGLLGPENVHISVYENDPDAMAEASLQKLRTRLTCKCESKLHLDKLFTRSVHAGNQSLISEHLPLEEIPIITIPSGEKKTKRIVFLAEVRNRALRSLRDSSSKFDKLLYLNDVMFNPIDAVQLLFSTNIGANGRTQYSAVCAVDFINAFKFYDRFATRDLEGYEMGVPFFPWFSATGNAISRQDVLSQKDAVRVRACWGGMTAFEASWFQMNQTDLDNMLDGDNRLDDERPSSDIAGLQLLPLQFRYELDPFWEASECCLIHADLAYLSRGRGVEDHDDTRIFTNPYVRVAYDSKTLSWLPYTRRLERLYPIIQSMVNKIAGVPSQNSRRLERPGDEVTELVWEYNGNRSSHESDISEVNGTYRYMKRVVGPGRFCGRRNLSILKETIKDGEKNFENVPLPLLPGRRCNGE